MDKNQSNHDDRLEDICAALDQKLEAIKLILTGTMDGKTKGLASVVQDVVTLLYDKENGALKRLERLENERTWMKGYLACAGAVGGLIVWVVEHWK